MKGHTIRISAQDQENVYREVLLPNDITFEDFHFAILDAFELEAGEMASFYISNKNWTKKQEITLMDMGMDEEKKDDTNKVLLMSDLKLSDVIDEKQQHFLYLYDFFFCNNFTVEVLSTMEDQTIEPLLVESVGEFKSNDDALTELMLDEFDPESAGNKKPTASSNKKSNNALDDFAEFDNFHDEDDSDEPQFENIDDFDDL